MSVTASGGLKREVVVPRPVYRRLSTVSGLCLALLMMASAADAVVWTYRAQRRYWRAEAAESLRRALSRRQAAERAAEPPPLADPMAPARMIEVKRAMSPRERILCDDPVDLCSSPLFE
ncbi:MAG TPA: hypothetical protein VEL05_07225 [Candidatus Acidoferrum sp.]|nr:hypothetical protein [Candidatus Acidoferrum sp.]